MSLQEQMNITKVILDRTVSETQSVFHTFTF